MRLSPAQATAYVDEQIAALNLRWTYYTPYRRDAIAAVIAGTPAILDKSSYHNQLAPNYLDALLSGDAERVADMERRRDIRNDALPYFVALNDPGRKLLAELHARFNPVSIAAE